MDSTGKEDPSGPFARSIGTPSNQGISDMRTVRGGTFMPRIKLSKLWQYGHFEGTN